MIKYASNSHGFAVWHTPDKISLQGFFKSWQLWLMDYQNMYKSKDLLQLRVEGLLNGNWLQHMNPFILKTDLKTFSLPSFTVLNIMLELKWQFLQLEIKTSSLFWYKLKHWQLSSPSHWRCHTSVSSLTNKHTLSLIWEQQCSSYQHHETSVNYTLNNRALFIHDWHGPRPPALETLRPFLIWAYDLTNVPPTCSSRHSDWTPGTSITEPPQGCCAWPGTVNTHRGSADN